MPKPKSLKETLKRLAKGAAQGAATVTQGISSLTKHSKDKNEQAEKLADSLKYISNQKTKNVMFDYLEKGTIIQKYFKKNENEQKTFQRGSVTGIMLKQLYDYLKMPYDNLENIKKALDLKPMWLKYKDVSKLKAELKKQLPVNWTKSVLYDKKVLEALVKISKQIDNIECEIWKNVEHEYNNEIEQQKQQKQQPTPQKKTPPPAPANPKPEIRHNVVQPQPASVPHASNTATKNPPPLPERNQKIATVRNIIEKINTKVKNFKDQTHIKTIEQNIQLMQNQLFAPSYKIALQNSYNAIFSDLNKCLKHEEPYPMNNAICDIIKKINKNLKPEPLQTQKTSGQVKNPRPAMPIPSDTVSSVSAKNDVPSAPAAPTPRSESAPPAPVVPKTDNPPRSASAGFLDEIKNGKKLKKASDRKLPDKPNTNSDKSNNLWGNAFAQIKNRRVAIEDDPDDDDNEIWDDE